MGYRTYFELELKDIADGDLDRIVDKLDDMGIIGYALDCNLDSAGDVTWYNEEYDMARLSLEFPHVHFIMHGEGESRDDVWEHHYRNGMFQELRAEFFMPALNPDNWKEHRSIAGLRPNDLPEFEVGDVSIEKILEVTG